MIETLLSCLSELIVLQAVPTSAATYSGGQLGEGLSSRFSFV